MTKLGAILVLTQIKKAHETMPKFIKQLNEKMAEERIEALDFAIEILSAEPNCQKCAIKELWKETEKEDLVSVVRCKDCTHYESDGGALMVCSDSGMVVDDTDYCSYGERREE